MDTPRLFFQAMDCGSFTSTIVQKEKYSLCTRIERRSERQTPSRFFQPQSVLTVEGCSSENRTAIHVINPKKQGCAHSDGCQISIFHADGDQWFQWSPGNVVLSDFIGMGPWNNKDIILLKTGGKSENGGNLTESGYSDSNAKWVLGGKAMIWNMYANDGDKCRIP